MPKISSLNLYSLFFHSILSSFLILSLVQCTPSKRDDDLGLSKIELKQSAPFECSNHSSTPSGQNQLNGTLTGGTARVIEISGKAGASAYDSNLSVDCSYAWGAPGTLCDEGDNIHSISLSSKTNGDSGATWDITDENSVGQLVIDLGSEKAMSRFAVFQMFSDGKTTHIRFLKHSNMSDTPPTAADAGWTPVNEFATVLAGSDVSAGTSVVGDPTILSVSAFCSRYLMIEVRNDGNLGSDGYIELRSVKAF